MTLDVPFTVSPSAEDHLKELLRYVAESVPESAELVPVLCPGVLVTTWTWQGASARPEHSGEVYFVRYYRPEQVADSPRVRVGGADLAAGPETFERMRGLHLILIEPTEGEPLSGRIVGCRS